VRVRVRGARAAACALAARRPSRSRALRAHTLPIARVALPRGCGVADWRR
jgi:hypothetical protein